MPTTDSNEELEQHINLLAFAMHSSQFERPQDRVEVIKKWLNLYTDLSTADREAAVREAIRLHRQEAHLAGKIEEAQNIKTTYTRRDGPSSVLNSVLTKRLKRYRSELHKVFTDHKASLNQPTKERMK